MLIAISLPVNIRLNPVLVVLFVLLPLLHPVLSGLPKDVSSLQGRTIKI